MSIGRSMMVATVVLLAGISGFGSSGATAADTSVPPGLHVEHGVLLKDGKPYRGVGANYFSLFSRIIARADDRSSLDNLEALSKAGIPFVRFMCCGFSAKDMKLYREDKKEYFRRLDVVVHEAEKQRIGLIPTLFWNLPAISDQFGEPLDSLGDRDSRTVGFIRTYTQEVVGRYKDSPAIWGWEFANESVLSCDLPKDPHEYETMLRHGSTGSEHVRRDLAFSQLKVAMKVFARTVREIDRDRIISTGNAVPRPAAYHNLHGSSWRMDTPGQFSDMLERDNPDPFDVVCVHVYPNAKSYYIGGAKSLDAAIGLIARYAKQQDKPLFIGEFGSDAQPDQAAEKKVFMDELNSIERCDVPLAAFWVFDLSSQNGHWNTTFDNARSYMIREVAKFNQRRAATGTQK